MLLPSSRLDARRTSLGRAALALALFHLAGCARTAAPAAEPAPTLAARVSDPAPPPVAAPAAEPGAIAPYACLAPSAPSTAFYGAADFPSAACRTRANDLLAKMTLREKMGQMLQLARDQVSKPDDIAPLSLGSVLSGGGSNPRENSAANWAAMVHEFHRASQKSRLGIPILYGSDAVHGHNNVKGAVIFPHNIGLGATRDPNLVERIGRATAEEAAATGVDWAFAPVVAPIRDERWGRTYEGFGETPELAELLGPAAIRGLQGPRLGGSPTSVLACAKHFVGDGATFSGVDRGDDHLEESEVRSMLLPAYAKAIDAKVGSIMVSYSSVRGVRMHCNGHLLTDVLKKDLRFNGFLVSDWEAIEQIGPSFETDLAEAINAGVDLVMHPKTKGSALDTMVSLVPQRVGMDRVDDAVRRILATKCEAGLLEPGRFRVEGDKIVPDAKLLSTVGSAAHREVAREAVRKSLVLLKNESVLPLAKDVSSVLVTGKNADNLGNQCGGWTIEWQGGSGAITTGTTILEGIRRAVSPKTRVLTSPAGAGKPGAAIVVIGETPYAEGGGDRTDLALDAADVDAVKAAKATGAPVVVLLVTGRPLILGPVVDLADAIAVAWLPGSEGAGVADVLFGDVAPTGKLPHTWPKAMADVPINVGDRKYEPLYAYGFGLSFPARAKR